MTAGEALAELVAAAERLADGYRRGSLDPRTARYRALMSNLDRWVRVYRNLAGKEEIV